MDEFTLKFVTLKGEISFFSIHLFSPYNIIQVTKLFNEIPIKEAPTEKNNAPSTSPAVINIDMSKTSSSKLINGIRGGFAQLSVMLKPPHLKNACLVYTIQFCILYGWELSSPLE